MKITTDKTKVGIERTKEVTIEKKEILWGIIKWNKVLKEKTTKEDIIIIADSNQPIDKIIFIHGDRMKEFNNPKNK